MKNIVEQSLNIDKLQTSDEGDFFEIQKLMTDMKQTLGDQCREFFQYVEIRSKADDTFKFWSNFVHRDYFAYVCLYITFRSSNWSLRMGPSNS